MSKLSFIIVFTGLLAITIIGCDKKNIQPATTSDKPAKQQEENNTTNALTSINGIRNWTGTSNHWPNGSPNTVSDTFEIIATSDTTVTVKNRTLNISWIDSSQHKMSLQLHDEPNRWHYILYYYYDNDSLIYEEWHYVSAGGGSSLQLHTL